MRQLPPIGAAAFPPQQAMIDAGLPPLPCSVLHFFMRSSGETMARAGNAPLPALPLSALTFEAIDRGRVAGVAMLKARLFDD